MLLLCFATLNPSNFYCHMKNLVSFPFLTVKKYQFNNDLSCKRIPPKVYIANDQEISNLSEKSEEAKAKFSEAPIISSFADLLKKKPNQNTKKTKPTNHKKTQK